MPSNNEEVPVLVCLECASYTRCVVRYLPDKVRFFSEVVWGHGEVPINYFLIQDSYLQKLETLDRHQIH